MAQHSIISIPPELTALVLEHAAPQTLAALRLVNQEVKGRAQEAFLKSYYTRRAYLLCSHHSLHNLVRLAHDPTRARYIRTLVFCVEEVEDPNELSTEDAAPSHFLGSTAAIRKQQKKDHLKHYKRQHVNYEDGTMLNQLTVAFSRLRLSNLVPDILVMDYASVSNSSTIIYGYNTICEFTGRRLGNPKDLKDTQFESVLAALLVICYYEKEGSSKFNLIEDSYNKEEPFNNAKEIKKHIAEVEAEAKRAAEVDSGKV